MKASPSKDRKSWFSMPRVPASWWRYSVPATSSGDADADDDQANRDKTPEPRAQSETLQISSPLPQNHADTRTSPVRVVDIESDPEYANTVSPPTTGDVDTNTIIEPPVVDEVTETIVTETTPPAVTYEQRLSELGMSILRDVPNISFSFFPDNDNIFSSSRIASPENSLERTGKQLGCISTNDVGNHGNVTEESNTHMAGDCSESSGKVSLRGDTCDGASYENSNTLRLSTSSSDYQSFNDHSIVTDLGNEECMFKNDTKRYESEYSIFIGKSVEIVDENVVNNGEVLVNNEKVSMQNNLKSVDAECSYASPRNSAVSVSSQDLSKPDENVHVIVIKSNPADDLYTQIKPRLSALSNKQLNDNTADPPNRLYKSKDKKYTSKSTKSLNEISRKANDIHYKSKSQNALHKAISKSESPPKLSLRNGSVKLSDKFDDSPINPSRKLSTASKANSVYQNHERPPDPPPLPPVDWTDSQESSSVYDLGSGGNTVISSPSTIPDDDVNYEDVEELEYCHHRDNGRRRVSLTRRTGKKGPGLVRVRSKLGRVVRAVSGWWSEERVKLGEVIQKHAHAQAVGATETETMCDGDTEEGEVDGVGRYEGLSEDGTVDEVEGSEKDGNQEAAVEGSANATPNMAVKRRVRKIGRPASRTRLSMRSRYFPEGQNGFEELRRYIKQGGDFCKDLSAILQERSEAESQYAKSLSKLSSKLIKASKDSVGTVSQAWQRAGTQMEAQSEIHRAFACALSDEVVKPLRQMVETQHRVRKNVEAAVDKTGKSLSEWRAAETKSKKQSFVSARENEKLQDAMLDVRLGRAGSQHALHHASSQKIVSDKESAKLDSKRRKAEDAVKKADVEYYTFCIRAERARLEWETAVIRGSHCFQAIEEERLQNLKDIASCYLQNLQEMGPKMVESTDLLGEPVHGCDVSRDIQTVVSIKGTGQPIPEQLLPDFYAEHITLAMNRDRRRNALVKLLQLVRQDIDRERRGKQGVENLARALQETPTFGTEDSQQNVTEKLHHMRSMLTYLEAARYKVQSALAELDGRTRGPHPLASHIQVTRDRQGLQQSVLKVPPWVRKESIDQMAGDSPDWTDRGAADGNSVQPDSDFDEFSSQGSDKDYQSSILTYPVISECSESTTSCGNTGQCKALYEYSANLYDELNLRPGDVINIHDKQPDGWWLGELNGVVGIFPATYVEEIK